MRNKLAKGPRAVVDIGSNSVRLVIYDGPPRAPMAICNEKALCGLGRGISNDGAMNPEAVNDALATLTRFQRLLREFDNPPTWTIATAAVRQATNGADFVAKARELGFDVAVVSGEEEATLAALGVISFVPGASGIAGDMGGGSLELVSLDNGAVGAGVSLRVGPLSLMGDTGDDHEKARSIIERELDSAPFLKTAPTRILYTVGGAWRAIARIHMGLRAYPLSVLHQYELTSAQAIEVCDLLARQSRRSLEDIPAIPRKRLDTLPLASIVLKSVLMRMNAKTMVVSAGGVREGLLYRALTQKERAMDPFLTACQFYASRLSPNPRCGETAAQFVGPLFENDAQGARLRRATALLMDIGAYFHPDLRARYAFETVLSAPFVGVEHKERLWAALALFCRHNGRSTPWPNENAIKLLDEERMESAVRFGLALRFVAAFAPKVEKPLEGCRLEYENGRLIFRAPSDRKMLMGQTPRRRFEALAAAFGAEGVEIYGE